MLRGHIDITSWEKIYAIGKSNNRELRWGVTEKGTKDTGYVIFIDKNCI